MQSSSLQHLLIKKRFDTDATGFRLEVSSIRFALREVASTPPLAPGLQVSFADEFLFASMEIFVALAIIVPAKGLAAQSADKRSFVSVCPK